MHPDFIEESLTKEQLSEWMVFDQLSPIGERRKDTRSAIQSYHFVSAMVDGENPEPHNFLPPFPIYDDEFSWKPETQAEVEQRHQREANQFL